MTNLKTKIYLIKQGKDIKRWVICKRKKLKTMRWKKLKTMRWKKLISKIKRLK